MKTKQQQERWFEPRNLLKLGLGLSVITALTSGEMMGGWPFFSVGKNFQSVLAQDLPGGMTFFSAPPQLVDSASTFDGVSIPTPKYYFTIALPANAGQGLAKVVFQRQDSPDPIEFYPDRTEAFTGDRQNLGESIAIASTTWDDGTGQLTVTFAEPVAPGQTVTLRLIPLQNPDVPGVYQFRLFAFPPGDQAQSMDMGVARFQFYRGVF